MKTTSRAPTLTITSGVELPVPFREQELKNWCWAACLSMIHEYVFDRQIEQCNVASDILNRSCCLNREGCNSAIEISEVAPWLVHNNVRTQTRNSPLAAALVQKILNDRNFILTAIDLPNLGGHMVIINGYEFFGSHLYLKITDPFHAKRQVEYRVFLKYWRSSWIIVSGHPLAQTKNLSETGLASARLANKLKIIKQVKLVNTIPIYSVKRVSIGKYKLIKTKFKFREVTERDRLNGLLKLRSNNSEYKSEVFNKDSLIRKIASTKKSLQSLGVKRVKINLLDMPRVLVQILFYRIDKKYHFEIIGHPKEMKFKRKKFSSLDECLKVITLIKPIHAINL